MVEASVASRATGIPQRRLQGWAARRVIRPAVAGAGRGSRRRFSRADCVVLALIDQLQVILGRRFRPDALADAVREWVDDFGIGDTFLVFRAERGKLSFGADPESNVLQRVKRGEVVLTINLALIRQRIDGVLLEH